MSFKAVLEADISNWQSNLNKAGAQLEAFDRKVKEQSKGLRYLGDSFINVGKKASILSAVLVGVGAKSFSMAADFEDAWGATGQIFKDNSDTVAEWANSLDTSYGIAKKEALEYSNLMGSMLINIGKLTEEQASKQSAKLIELAGDLTAMYGGTTQDAVRALTGALKGNTQMLDNYGMGVNDAIIKQKALELGLISNTSEMSQQAKQAATLALIWEQTGAAQGQAAREADGASGAMRKFRTEVANLSTELGETLLPIITPMINKLTEATQGFRSLSTETQAVIVKVAGAVAVAGPLLVVIGNILKALPLIKAALVALSGPIGWIAAAIVAATALIIANWDKIKTASNNVVEYIKDDWNRLKESLAVTSSSISKLMKADFRGWWEDVKKSFDLSIDYITNRWKQFKNIFKDTLPEGSGFDGIKLGALEGLGEDIKEKLDTPMLSASEVIKITSDKIASLTKKLNDLRSGKIKSADIVGDITTTTNQIEELTKTLEILKGKTKDIEEPDTFQKLIGEQLNVRDAVNKTVSTIEDLQSKLVKLQLGILPSTNVRQELAETQQQIDDLSTALDLLTGGRELNIKVNTDISGIEAAENKFLKDGKFVLPAIDTSALDASMGDLSQKAQAIKVTVGDVLGNLFADASTAIMEGDNVMTALGSSMLGMLGGIMIDLGKMALGIGIGLEAIQKALMSLNPALAIGAGAALIALGSLFSAGSRKLASTMGSGGAGYSSAPSLRNTGPSYGPSEYRGPYQDALSGKVVFEIGNDKLVGVLEQANRRNNRLV